MLKKFKSLQTGFREVDMVQGNLKEKFEEIDNQEILDGILIKDVSISTTNISLGHKLGRKYIGFMVVDNQDGLIVQNTRSSQDDLYLTIKTTAGTGKVSLWVF